MVKAEFEPTTWQAFWRAAVEGDAAANIAADLGVTKWAIYKAKARVTQRLREELDGLLTGWEDEAPLDTRSSEG